MGRTLRILAILAVASLGGCSTAPVAGTLDCFFPSRGQTNDEPRIQPPGLPGRPPRTDDPLLPFDPTRPDR